MSDVSRTIKKIQKSLTKLTRSKVKSPMNSQHTNLTLGSNVEQSLFPNELPKTGF